MTTRASGGSGTVVVADDTAFVRDRFKTALEGAGHDVQTVASSNELLTVLRAGIDAVCLLLLDLRVSKTNGMELVRTIRGLEGGASLPIVVFSGTIASVAEVRALDALHIAGYVNEYGAAQHILAGLRPHLAPGTAVRRSSPRVLLGVPVTYRFGNTIAAGVTLNVGRGGLAIRTTSPLARDASLRARFRLRGAPKELDLMARVAWSDRGVGMGLEFNDVSDEQRKALDDYVDGHFFSNRKA